MTKGQLLSLGCFCFLCVTDTCVSYPFPSRGEKASEWILRSAFVDSHAGEESSGSLFMGSLAGWILHSPPLAPQRPQGLPSRRQPSCRETYDAAATPSGACSQLWHVCTTFPPPWEKYRQLYPGCIWALSSSFSLVSTLQQHQDLGRANTVPVSSQATGKRDGSHSLQLWEPPIP